VRRSIGLKKDECVSAACAALPFACNHGCCGPTVLLRAVAPVGCRSRAQSTVHRIVSYRIESLCWTTVPLLLWCAAIQGHSLHNSGHWARRYFLQNKLVTKQDIANLLESAGFSR
jgi:hypothetical protein